MYHFDFSAMKNLSTRTLEIYLQTNVNTGSSKRMDSLPNMVAASTSAFFQLNANETVYVNAYAPPPFYDDWQGITYFIAVGS